MERHASPLLTWLALLAIGLQTMFPLSIGFQIAEHGAAAAHATMASHSGLAGDADPVSIVTAIDGSQAGSILHPASHTKPDTGHSPPVGGCALCIALQVLQAFSEATAPAVPMSLRIGTSWQVAADYEACRADPSASYRSRAPPVMA